MNAERIPPGEFLEVICARRRKKLREAEAVVSLAEIRRRAGSAPPPRGFRDCLETAEGISVIAEIKRASPSAGVFKQGLLPASLAEIYQFAGARAISVLTEEDFFLGRPGDLTAVRERVDLPLLRKDFILEPYQVYESRALGADAVLLIVAILTPERLRELLRITGEVGMDALVEVHRESEADIALEAGAVLIGVNNRNLHDFTVNLEISVQLAGRIPASVTRVAESGIRTREDIDVLRKAGYRSFLIGETLVRSENPARTLRELVS